MSGSITDVAGIEVGHHHRCDSDATVGDESTPGTGWACGTTVVLAPPGTVGAVDVRGGAPGSRETELLQVSNSVRHVDAVVLSGGSAFGLAALPAGKSAFAVIWTTTAWTIPANQALNAHPEFTYALVETPMGCLVLAETLVEKCLERFGLTGNVLATAKGEALRGQVFRHPLHDVESGNGKYSYHRLSPLYLADYVSDGDGTVVAAAQQVRREPVAEVDDVAGLQPQRRHTGELARGRSPRGHRQLVRHPSGLDGLERQQHRHDLRRRRHRSRRPRIDTREDHAVERVQQDRPRGADRRGLGTRTGHLGRSHTGRGEP